MKALKIKICFSLLLLFHLSCSDFLDREPLDQLTDASFYQTESDARRAILAAYTPMMDQNWSGKGWQITEIPSDNSQAGGLDPEFTPIDNFTVTADNPTVANYWAIHYRQVALANVVLEKIEGMSLEDALKDQYRGEAKFLRAIAYFDLVRVYGGVPLVLTAPEFGDDFLLPRASAQDIYDQIESDLEDAEASLPEQWSGQDVGRATRGAALAYLAKVNLKTRQYVKARDYAKEVMDMGIYSLMPDFADNFELSTCDNNQEAIFQIQFAGCGTFGTGNPMQAFFAPWGEGITKDRDGWGSQIPTSSQQSNPGTTIQDAFEEGDLRLPVTIMVPNTHYPSINPNDGGYTYPPTGASATGVNIKKYVVGSGSNICFMSTPQNVHMIRYADILLIYAETVMEIGGGITSDPAALQAFNQVRERAGLDPLTQIDKEIIFQERRVELAFEGHRWFDLLRMGNAVEILTLHGKDPSVHHLLFPIPVSEIKINPNLEQNPGY